MTAARCTECGQHSVKRGDVTVTIRHDPDCETGNDYQPQLNETLSMRDIVVPSTLAEVKKVLAGLMDAYLKDMSQGKPRWPEVHFIIKYEDNAESSGSFVEVRGRVKHIVDPGKDATLRVLEISVDRENMRAVAYKSVFDEPEPISAIDISRMMRPVPDNGGNHEFVFAAFQLQSISIVHEPSPLIPVVTA